MAASQPQAAVQQSQQNAALQAAQAQVNAQVAQQQAQQQAAQQQAAQQQPQVSSNFKSTYFYINYQMLIFRSSPYSNFKIYFPNSNFNSCKLKLT